MELISWSLNAIDTILSRGNAGSGEPTCPDGTFAAGYTMDSWNKWNIVCLAPLSLEDVEDVYIFGCLIAGVLMIGLGMFLIYRQIGKQAANKESPKLSAVISHHCGAVADQVRALHQKVTRIEELYHLQSVDIPRRLDTITNMFWELCKSNATQSAIMVTHQEEMTRGLTALQGDITLGATQNRVPD